MSLTSMYFLSISFYIHFMLWGNHETGPVITDTVISNKAGATAVAAIAAAAVVEN